MNNRLNIVDYSSSPLQMGDLLLLYNVDFSDFSLQQKENLINHLESYLKYGFAHPVVIDLGKVKVQLQGADEISYLLWAIPRSGDSDA